MIGILLMVAAAAAAWGYVYLKPEQEPQEKITGTGVVEQVIGGENGRAQYTVRFTGERNRSYVAKTARYTGTVDKYEDGKLVHIRYWFGKKGQPGVEMLDDELTRVTDTGASPAQRWCLLASGVLFLLGIVLLIV